MKNCIGCMHYEHVLGDDISSTGYECTKRKYKDEAERDRHNLKLLGFDYIMRGKRCCVESPFTPVRPSH